MIPKKVNVAGVHYSVKEKTFIEIAHNKNYLGLCSYNDTEIQVLDSLSNERKKEVFVHELTHAIFNEAEFDEQDEEVISRVGRVLYQVLKDNDFGFLKDKVSEGIAFQHHNFTLKNEEN
jgi:hypothetical protein